MLTVAIWGDFKEEPTRNSGSQDREAKKKENSNIAPASKDLIG